MRPISKSGEPRSLTEHRCTPHADYDNYAGKDDLRLNLTTEQGKLCCYCMQRIEPDASRMKIEHWRSQTGYPAEQLNYANLLGACLGNEGKPPRLQHCDTLKGDAELRRNPAVLPPRVDRDLHYWADGSLHCDDAAFDTQLNEVLQLNLDSFKRNRKAVLDALYGWAERKGDLRRSDVEGELDEWLQPSDNALREYCGVAIYWLNKRLARF